MKRRYVYAWIGLVFGVIDWFYYGWSIPEFGFNLGEKPFMVIGRMPCSFLLMVAQKRKTAGRNSA